MNPINLTLVTTEARILAEQKEADFLEKVNEVQRIIHDNGLAYRTTDICKIAAMQPAKRFYIDAAYALKQYSKYQKGQCVLRHKETKRMFTDIFSRYEHIVNAKKKYGQKIVKSDIMRQVVESEAPCFYYSDNSAVASYYLFVKKKRAKNKELFKKIVK